MRIVAIDAELSSKGALRVVPITTGSPMHSRFPVAVSWAMAATAQGRAVGQFHFVSVTGLEQLEVLLIVTVVTVVVSIMTAMLHGDV